MTPNKLTYPKYSACYIWAPLQKLKYGGYLKIQLTPNYICMPRVSWSEDNITWYGYVPLNPVRYPTLFQKIFPFHTLLFKGIVVKRKS